MKDLNAIEKRFGITLPKLYRDLAEQGRLKQGSKNHFAVEDWDWLTPRQIARFEWEDYLDPVEGLVPFATDGDGDTLCWYLPEPGLDGEPAVVRCAHDNSFGEYLAPSLAGAVFRQTLTYLQVVTDDPEGWEDNKQAIDDVLPILSQYAPKPWCDALAAVKDLDLVTNELGEPALMRDEDFDRIILQAFGKDYLDREFPWEKHATLDE